MRGAGAGALRAEALRALFALATEPEQDFLVRLLVGELRQGALVGVMTDAIAAAADAAGHAGAPRNDVREQRRCGRARSVARRRSGPREVRARDPLADRTHAGTDRSRSGRRAAPARRRGRVRVEDGRCTHPGARSGEVVRIFTRNLNDVGAAIPEIVEAVRALPARDLILDGEAIAFDANGRPHPFQIDDAPVRPPARHREAARGAADARVLLRLPAHRRPQPRRSCRSRSSCRARRRGSGRVADPAHRHDVSRRGAGVLRRRARGRSRRPDGEVARRAVRSRQSRRGLAQDQARAHARSRRHRSRVGPRPAQRQAFEPAPRRARSRDRRVRDARQDIQGPHRRDARMADEGVPRTRGPPRRLHRAMCVPSSSSRSLSAICRRARAIPAVSRCASRA